MSQFLNGFFLLLFSNLFIYGFILLSKGCTVFSKSKGVFFLGLFLYSFSSCFNIFFSFSSLFKLFSLKNSKFSTSKNSNLLIGSFSFGFITSTISMVLFVKPEKN